MYLLIQMYLLTTLDSSRIGGRQ